jgi:hypothetical protein
MKTYGGVDVWIHVFLTSALVVGEGSASRPGRFIPEERAPVSIGEEARSGRREEEKKLSPEAWETVSLQAD